jgi:oligoendopeptidase F
MTKIALRSVLSSVLMSLAVSSSADAAPASPATPVPDPAHVWDLSLIYKDEAAFDAARKALVADLARVDTFKGRLGTSAATLREALELVSGLRKTYARLSSYASMASDEDLGNGPALARDQQISMVGAELSRALSFLAPEILSMGEEKVRTFLTADPGLAPYRFDLLDTLRRAPHTLGDEAEGVISSASLIADGPYSTYSVFTNAELPWPTISLSDGTQAKLDQSGYTRWRAAPNRADREAVFRAFWGKMKEFERTLGASLFAHVKGDWFRARVRKYPNSVSAAISGDNIPEAVYRTLVRETNANLPTLHRYFRLRARMLGVAEPRYWDIYPPLVTLDRKFPYDESRRLTIESAAPLGEAYAKELTAAVNGRYVHVYPREGKRSGAYMNGSVYDVHAFVLLNHNDDYESLTTMAHEWGHGMHSQLSNRTQPYPTSQYATFTAEIASTLPEALLLDKMLTVAANDDERLFYLGNALESLRGTFFRQAMFAEFELRIHEEVEKGEALTGDRLTALYADLLRRHHGHAEGVMKIDDLVTVEWAYIPHFYYNFYVYQYATAIAASQLFAERILRGEPGARDTYLAMLKAGGSDYPYDLVKRAGVDLATPEPYRALATRMNRIMDEIETILARRAGKPGGVKG